MLVNLASALSAADCKSIVASFEDSRQRHLEVAEESARRGLRVETIPCDGRADWRAVRALRTLIYRHKVDVLHPHGYKSDLYAYAANLRGKTALMATSHNWPSRKISMRAYGWLDRRVLRKFDGIAVVSELVAKTLKGAGVPAERISVVANGIDIAQFQNASPRLRRELGWEQHKIVAFVGRLVPEKGGDVLLRSICSISPLYPEARFVFVGEGPARAEWERLATSLGIAGRVRFVGFRPDMPEVFSSIDLLVLPSLTEAMPMCLIEAMAAAKPVIATNVGAIPAVIEPGVNGLLVRAGDDTALSRAIARVLDNPGLGRRLGENGQARAVERHSASAMARNYIRLYERAIENRKLRTGVSQLWTLKGL